MGVPVSWRGRVWYDFGEISTQAAGTHGWVGEVADHVIKVRQGIRDPEYPGETYYMLGKP